MSSVFPYSYNGRHWSVCGGRGRGCPPTCASLRLLRGVLRGLPVRPALQQLHVAGREPTNSSLFAFALYRSINQLIKSIYSCPPPFQLLQVAGIVEKHFIQLVSINQLIHLPIHIYIPINPLWSQSVNPSMNEVLTPACSSPCHQPVSVFFLTNTICPCSTKQFDQVLFNHINQTIKQSINKSIIIKKSWKNHQ